MRLDLLRQLVAEKERPPARKGQRVGAGFPSAGRSRGAPLAQPPVLERGEEAARGRSQPARLEPSFGVEPQRRARLGEQQARTAQGSRDDAVEQQRIALGEAGREAAQHRRRDVELADEKSARGGLTFGACAFRR